MLDQSRSVEMAYGWGEAEERGISWRELLHTNLMYVQPLSDQPPEEKVDGTASMSVDSSAFPVDPREHYLPILLEGARVWRRAVMETIDRRLDRDIKDKNYSAWEERSEHDDRYRTAQHLIPPVDRRLLARQARRIVRRYLVLHNVFPTSETEDKVSAFYDCSHSIFHTFIFNSKISLQVLHADHEGISTWAYYRVALNFFTNYNVITCTHFALSFHMVSQLQLQIHSWDDFSKSSVIGSAHFLDFVYYEFLRPAFNMGWGGLICEKMDDEASPASSSLLGPVVGALQNILAKTKGQSSVSFGYDPDHTKRKHVIGWVRNQHARLAQLGEATAILEAKVAALGRITKTDGSTHMEEDGCSQRYGRDHTFDEANIILDDCVDDWTSLAEHRHSGQSKSYGTGVADKLAITANQIVHTYKRFHRVDSAGPTSNKVHRLTEFVYNKFLLPGHNLDIPKLATSTQAVGHESLVGTYTRGMHSIHSASSESQTAAFVPTNLRRIDICPLTWNLRVKLDSLEGCSESSQAPELLQSCLALWKSAALAFSDQGQCADQVGDESKLIVLAGRITLQHQCLQKTNASGVDFSTSCIKETTSILDFVYDNFLCYGSEFDIDFARMHQNKAKRVSFPGLSGREMSPNHQDHKTHCNLRDGPYEIIIGAIQNLNEMGRNDLAREYYDKFCLAGTENGEHKAYLDAELPFIASF